MFDAYGSGYDPYDPYVQTDISPIAVVVMFVSVYNGSYECFGYGT